MCEKEGEVEEGEVKYKSTKGCSQLARPSSSLDLHLYQANAVYKGGGGQIF